MREAKDVYVDVGRLEPTISGGGFSLRSTQRGSLGSTLRDRMQSNRLNVLVMVQEADEGSVAMVAQAAGVNGRGEEGVAKRVHLNERGRGRSVAKVIEVKPPGE